jgi:hypothetical protein
VTLVLLVLPVLPVTLVLLVLPVLPVTLVLLVLPVPFLDHSSLTPPLLLPVLYSLRRQLLWKLGNY